MLRGLALLALPVLLEPVLPALLVVPVLLGLALPALLVAPVLQVLGQLVRGQLVLPVRRATLE